MGLITMDPTIVPSQRLCVQTFEYNSCSCNNENFSRKPATFLSSFCLTASLRSSFKLRIRVLTRSTSYITGHQYNEYHSKSTSNHWRIKSFCAHSQSATMVSLQSYWRTSWFPTRIRPHICHHYPLIESAPDHEPVEIHTNDVIVPPALPYYSHLPVIIHWIIWRQKFWNRHSAGL